MRLDELLQKGLEFHRSGNLERAERTYREVLRRAPANGTAWYLRSVIAMGQKDYARGSSLLEHAVRHEPENAMFLCNLGEAYRRLGRPDAAVAALQRAVTSKPDLAEAQYNLGIVLREERRFDDALSALEAALAHNPRLPGLGLEILTTFSEMGREDLGIAAYRRHESALLDDATLRVAIADIYLRNHLPDDAIAHLERALELEPNGSAVLSSYAIALADRGEIGAALAQQRKAVESSPDDSTALGNYLFMLQFDPAATAERIRTETERFQAHAEALLGREPHANSPDPERPLRVGYVSADFREHSIARFALPLLRNHDCSDVEVFCYSNAARSDAVTERFRALAGEWRDIAGKDAAAVADTIRRDGIDVLVDLGMHTAHNRLLVFARKPAPVQVTYLAYLGTTGLAAIDYRFTEPRLDPPDEVESRYTERSVWLPDGYWCYDPGATSDVSELPASRNGHVTFGSMNAFRKVNEETLSLWASILGAVHGSRLLVHAPPGVAVERTRRFLQAHGVDPARLEFVGKQPRAEYFESYRCIDVCLDTTPYNGGTTSLDAYWMGVPVVTRLGSTVVGRAGYAIAHQLGLPDVVARSDEEYVECAARLAADTARLASLRAELRERLRRSPLMDAPRFARNVERAYRKMWRDWCDSRGRE